MCETSPDRCRCHFGTLAAACLHNPFYYSTPALRSKSAPSNPQPVFYRGDTSL